MANTTFLFKKSSTPSAVPTSLDFGELALNYADGKLYYKNSNSVIVEFAPQFNTFGSVSANGTTLVADQSNDILTITPGSFINIIGNAVNDTITISADVAPAFDKANTATTIAIAAFAQANSGSGGSTVYVSNTSPSNVAANSLWWSNETGRLSILYNDGSSSQWVDTSGYGGSYGSGSSINTTRFVETEIDFGSVAVHEKKFIIPDSNVTASSVIVATHSLKAATGKSQDENEMDSLILSAYATSENVVIYARAIPGPVSGKFKINYSTA